MAISSDEQLTLEDRLLIEQQCTGLSYAFAYHIDRGEFEDVIALFTPDCLFDRAGLVHRGHDEIREGMRERPDVTTRHLMTNFHFDSVGADEATAVVYAMTYHAMGTSEDEPLVYATDNGRLLDMRDRYVRTTDGWRIASRIARAVLKPEVWP